MVRKIALKPSAKTENIPDEAIEIAKCRGSFPYFLRYVKTDDTQRGLGIMPFPDYPYLHNIAADLQRNRLNLVHKPRQMLFTWLLAAKRIWKANFYPHSNPLVISQGEEYSKAFLDRCWFIYENMPDYLKCQATKKATHIEWTNIGSEIISLPCTKNVGRSLSTNDVTLDEAAFFQWGAETFAAIAPSIDKYGCLDIGSTSNGKDPLFYELVNDPQYREVFNFIDLKWTDHPERNEEWKQEIISMIGLKRWLREYEKFWFAPLGKPVFEANWKDSMIEDCFDQWVNADVIVAGLDRGYHHPAVLWTFINPDDQWCKVAHWMASDMERDKFLLSVKQQTEGMFPGKPVIYWVPADFNLTESDGQNWFKKMRDLGMSVKVGKAGRDEKVRRTDAQRKPMKLRRDGKFSMIVDPRCDILIEGYKGGYCYPQVVNKPEDECPQKDGWYDHLQDCDAVIADNHFDDPVRRKPPVSSTVNQEFDKITGRPI
jgi:hypothetical protein